VLCQVCYRRDAEKPCGTLDGLSIRKQGVGDEEVSLREPIDIEAA
jgi:hypothetical protein